MHRMSAAHWSGVDLSSCVSSIDQVTLHIVSHTFQMKNYGYHDKNNVSTIHTLWVLWIVTGINPSGCVSVCAHSPSEPLGYSIHTWRQGEWLSREWIDIFLNWEWLFFNKLFFFTVGNGQFSNHMIYILNAKGWKVCINQKVAWRQVLFFNQCWLRPKDT